MADKPKSGLLQRLGSGFDRYIGGLLGEDLESMTPEERANARRQAIGAIGRSMMDPASASEQYGAVVQARAQQRARGELARRTAAAEAAMPDLASRVFGGTGGRSIEALPGAGGEAMPMTARRVPTREGAREALGMLYGTQVGQDVAKLTPGLVDFAKEGVTGRTVGGSVYNPLTGRFDSPRKALEPKTVDREVDFGNRKIVYFSDGTSQEFKMGMSPSAAGGGSGAKGADLTADERKRVFESRDMIAASEDSISGLRKALTLSPLAYEGIGASTKALAKSTLPGEDKNALATIEFDILLKQQVLPMLKTVFGGNPTEGERQILIDLQGSSSLPRSTREKLLSEAILAAQTRIARRSSEVDAIVSGTYFKPGAPPSAPAGAPPASAPQADFVFQNGRLVPVKK
jgi:hypothetical protein